MCNNPRFYPDIVDPRTGKMIPCPCHKCSGCRIDRITLWDRRITSEYVKTRSSFVTLTYNDYFLPYNPGSVFPTVRRQDLSRFLDNLRHFVHSIPDEVFPSMCTKNYKVVACSEYGENGTRRPHYHIIFLGLDWHNFRQVFIKKWPKGIVDVGPLRAGGIRYVLKYISKQQFSEKAIQDNFCIGRDIPFMSFSPGIGKDFFISQIDNISKYGMAKVGNRFIPIPSYWKNKLFNYCDKNVYQLFESRNKYTEQLNSQCRSMGFDSYDSYLRQARKALEHSYEMIAKSHHEYTSNLSYDLPDFRLNPFSDLVTDYKTNRFLDFLNKIA